MKMDQINIGDETIISKDLFKENFKEITQKNSREYKFM